MSSSVLITGGTSGIGQAIVQVFLDHDWRVHLHYRSSKKEARTLSEQENNVNTIQANLRESNQCEELVNTLLEDDSLTVIVNNAALFSRSSPGETETDNWDAPMEVNARAPWHLSQGLASILKKNEGSIVNLTDAALDRPYRDYLPYFASKGALQNLTQGLARELSPNVRVNAVAPGPIDFPDEYTTDKKQTVINRTLLERKGQYEEIAECVYFLGVKATYSTGTVLEVDGGRHLN